MVEIVCRIVGHLETFHHGARASIDRCRDRCDFGKMEPLERKLHGCSSALARVSMPPGFDRQTPADFVDRRKVRFERNGLQCDDAGKAGVLFAFQNPPAVPIALECGPQPSATSSDSSRLATSWKNSRTRGSAFIAIHASTSSSRQPRKRRRGVSKTGGCCTPHDS
jgi:hypothetical protein